MHAIVTSSEAAVELGVSKGRVLALVRAGRLPAQLVGVQFLIKKADLDLVRDRKPGRPKKVAPAPPAKKGRRKRQPPAA